MGTNKDIKLHYLVFDDNPEAEITHKKEVKIPGCECHVIFINPEDFYNVEKNKFNHIDFQKEIKEKTEGKTIHLIITDWNIMDKSDDFGGICGWDIITDVIKAKEKLKSKPFLIYSANLKSVSDYIVNHIKQEIESNNQVGLPVLKAFISMLLELRIKCHKRNDNSRFEEIKTLLNQTNTISNMVLNTVHSYEDHTINMGNEIYDGKKIKDIISSYELDNGGLKFIREFIELSIAHYTNLSDD